MHQPGARKEGRRGKERQAGRNVGNKGGKASRQEGRQGRKEGGKATRKRRRGRKREKP